LANTDAAKANAEQNRAETAYLPTKHSLEQQLISAQVRNYDEPNRAASVEERFKAGDDDAGVQLLKEWGKDIVDRAIKSGSMTQLEAENWIRDVYFKAKELGISPRKMLDDQAKTLAPIEPK
jgi:hypothetical protein